MLYNTLTVPRWLNQITPNTKGHTLGKIIYGGDTETVNGEPMSMQFYSEDNGEDSMLWVNKDNACSTFLRWCKSRRSNVEHVMYIHNLEFDLVELIFGHHAKLVSPEGDFDFVIDGWRITGTYGKPTFCRISNGHDKSVLLVDSFSYFRGSLEKAATLFCPDLPKLERPEGLGEKRFTKKDAGFIEYAMRDSVVAYHIGKQLEKLHQEFDLKQTVSVADMAARVFRHQFLTYTIPLPSRAILKASLLAYHGGKNNIAAPPGWYEDVSSLDLSSAYPHAMASFPEFSDAKAYKSVKTLSARAKLPVLGIYQVWGSLSDCKWPVLFDHSFNPMHACEVEGVWVTGYELAEAQASGEFKLRRASGYVYDAKAREYDSPALKNFVHTFYERKEAEKDKVKRTMFKLILNSLSGKFVQTKKSQRLDVVDADTGKITTSADLVAGGLFHPFIAASITGHTRARIHQLEHKYKALHTATDGIFTQSKKLPREKGLGAAAVEAQGELLLVRNKLYILYSKDGDIASAAFKGKRIAKFALHGFLGKVHDLEKLVATGRRKYTASRMNKLRESMRRGLIPNKFEKRDYTLKVGPLHVVKKGRKVR